VKPEAVPVKPEAVPVKPAVPPAKPETPLTAKPGAVQAERPRARAAVDEPPRKISSEVKRSDAPRPVEPLAVRAEPARSVEPKTVEPKSSEPRAAESSRSDVGRSAEAADSPRGLEASRAAAEVASRRPAGPPKKGAAPSVPAAPAEPPVASSAPAPAAPAPSIRTVRVRLVDGSTVIGVVRAEQTDSLVVDCSLGLLSIPRNRIATIAYDAAAAIGSKRAPVQQLDDDDRLPRKRAQ
jgi:hypothetical protein